MPEAAYLATDSMLVFDHLTRRKWSQPPPDEPKDRDCYHADYGKADNQFFSLCRIGSARRRFLWGALI